MIQYIIYCLDIRTYHLDIVGIVDDEKDAKNIQNNHSFSLLCELNKLSNLYRLEFKENVIQVQEISINIQKGWISNQLNESKIPIYEIGIKTYYKKIDSVTPVAPLEIKEIISKKNNQKIKNNGQEKSWDNVLMELKKRRETIH
jgi:hypothetical protein